MKWLLAALCGLAPVVLPWLLAPGFLSDWPDSQIARLAQRTGVAVELEGGRDWRLFPTPGWVVQGARFHDRKHQLEGQASEIVVRLHGPSLLGLQLKPTLEVEGLMLHSTHPDNHRPAIVDARFAISPLDGQGSFFLDGQLELARPSSGTENGHPSLQLSAEVWPEPGQLQIRQLRLQQRHRLHPQQQDQWITGDITLARTPGTDSHFDLQTGPLDIASWAALLAGGQALARPVHSKEAAAEQPGRTARGATTTVADDSALQGRLQVEQLKLGSWPLKDLDMQLLYRNRRIDASHISARLFGGQLEGKASVDLEATAQGPQLSARIHATDVDLGAWPGGQSYGLAGQVSGQARLLGQGLERQQLLRTLQGVADFTLRDGAFRGPDLDQLVCTHLAGGSTSSTATAAGAGSRATFTSAQGHLAVDGGQLHLRDLNVQLATAVASGSGSMDLATGFLDANLGIRLTGNNRCPVPAGLAAIDWPLRCQGRLGTRQLCQLDKDAGQRALRDAVIQLLAQ